MEHMLSARQPQRRGALLEKRAVREIFGPSIEYQIPGKTVLH